MIPCEPQKAQQKRKMKKERKLPHVRIKDLKRKKKKRKPLSSNLFQNLDILLFTITVIFNHSPQEIIQLPYSCF